LRRCPPISVASFFCALLIWICLNSIPLLLTMTGHGLRLDQNEGAPKIGTTWNHIFFQ
jgi:hypothetical protein